MGWFPATVNERAARLVAAQVLLVTVLILLTGIYWPLPLLAAGFFLRVLAGAKVSPFAKIATATAKRLWEFREVPGPPKRFAQSIGLVLTTTASVAALVFGATSIADICLGLMVVATTLEAGFGLCVGCQLFSLLMRIGLIPEEVCAACQDLSLAPSRPVA